MYYYCLQKDLKMYHYCSCKCSYIHDRRMRFKKPYLINVSIQKLRLPQLYKGDCLKPTSITFCFSKWQYAVGRAPKLTLFKAASLPVSDQQPSRKINKNMFEEPRVGNLNYRNKLHGAYGFKATLNSNSVLKEVNGKPHRRLFGPLPNTTPILKLLFLVFALQFAFYYEA